MLIGKEISWRHIKGSKMRVDFAEQTLSKEVEDTLTLIEELKEISKEIRNFIKYLRIYRQIMHSKINFQLLEDPRIKTLKKIRDWFINGDIQKKKPREWISTQCQFDLIISINGFLEMLSFLFKKYPCSMVQSKRILQDTLEGLFRTIRELGRDSSTQTLKSYGHVLNKYRITALVSSEIKSFNYGNASCNGHGINYRKNKEEFFINNKDNSKYQERLIQLSSFSRIVFENLLLDNLFMSKIEIPLEAYNENVKQENNNVLYFQSERNNLIKTILYQDSINKLLEKWRNIIKKIAYEAIPKKIRVQWLANWKMNLEGSSTQRLVAYLILQKVIKFTFSTNTEQKNLYSVDPQLISNTIINFELAEASKFSYITGWVIYKLIKSDNIMKSHPKYEFICIYLKVLSSEKVVYDLLCNLSLLESFNILINITNQKLYTSTENNKLTDEDKDFLYKRIIIIYMKSRQKSWRRFNEFIPEKGISSLRENLKAMKKNTKKIENYTSIKKSRHQLYSDGTFTWIKLASNMGTPEKY
ncbi:hypothetical protein Glove_368g17 [Diversispora epigaea]|uniref:Uncharacterized protein n=1 Tax=Diversispora epigaea TaxID=1348612 RepID=A0A397HAQ0_9GLOM|nr:hypothetical protein Glove_368g17 [Diversispora epigaea]